LFYRIDHRLIVDEMERILRIIRYYRKRFVHIVNESTNSFDRELVEYHRIRSMFVLYIEDNANRNERFRN